ncbi:type II secretion system GspH family protein [Patescibacteria group bacterium]|nr:type II secretion system GspH family protein [Patescibacteria group bacterium]MBU1931715.1 type II secretion system GspH family protein [Patescibacteria group bacterium]
MKKQNGFSFIELLVTISIIGIIAAVGLATYSTSQQKSRNTKRKADLKQIQVALEMCRSEEGTYPTGLNDLTPDYMGELPEDPETGESSDYYFSERTNYTYTICADEAELETICYSNP